MEAAGFRQVTIAGSATERGRSYGEQLANEILATVAVYQELLPLPAKEVLRRGRQARAYLLGTGDLRLAEFVAEIDAMCEAICRTSDSAFDAAWLYALNARTEILGLGVDECTALYLRRAACLCQNWDWVERLEQLAVFLTVVPDDGPTIWMLTEPGIIGKIGMNSRGIGVCLNILRCQRAERPAGGLPIHLVLRMILNANSLDEARQVIGTQFIDTTSNILAGDRHGTCFDVEFAGTEQHWSSCQDEITLHTNHYCVEGTPLNDGFEDDLQSSFRRYERAQALTTATTGSLDDPNIDDLDIDDLDRVLSDRSGPLPINRVYESYPQFPSSYKVGTVATLLMDLKQQRFFVRRGPVAPEHKRVEMPLRLA